jgi:hypothetical protein
MFVRSICTLGADGEKPDPKFLSTFAETWSGCQGLGSLGRLSTTT